MSFLKPLDMAQIHNESKYFQTSAISQPTNFDKSLPVPVIETKNQKKRQRDGSELNDQHDCTCSRESNKSSQISGRVNSSFLAGKNAKPTVTNNTATHKIYPLSKKYKTAPQSLLSGTTQDELSVTVNPTKETIGRSPLPSASGSTLNTQHLAGPCRTTDSSSTCKVEGKLGTKSTQGLEESQSNDAQSRTDISGDQIDGSFLLITRQSDCKAQCSTKSVISTPTPTLERPLLRTRARMKRLAQENEIYDAEIAAEVDSMDEVEATGHRDGFQGALEDEQIPPCTAKPKRTQRLFLDKAKQKANAEIDKSESFDNGPSFEDSGHGIAENPSNSISQLRQNSVFVRNRNNPAGEPLEFVARFDTCADSNFISSRAAKNHGFDILPLVPADITTYEMLEGECTPDHMVTLELQYPRSPRFYTDSFRVVKNNSFDILVGSTTIEKRGIVVQQHKQGIAFPSFKKKPNDAQAAQRKAIQERDHQTARELYQNMNTRTSSTQGSTDTNNDQSGSSSSASHDKSNGGGNGNSKTGSG